MANVLTNPSFETDTTGWTASSSGTTLTRITTDFVDGAACASWARASGATANMTLTINPTNSYAATPGQVWSAGARIKLGGGTARQIRCDVLYYDAANANIGSTNGFGGEVTVDGTWQQIKIENVTMPALTAFASMRLVAIGAAIGDTVKVDNMQLEQGATLPAFDAGGGEPAQVTYVHNGSVWVPATTTVL